MKKMIIFALSLLSLSSFCFGQVNPDLYYRRQELRKKASVEILDHIEKKSTPELVVASFGFSLGIPVFCPIEFAFRTVVATLETPISLLSMATGGEGYVMSDALYKDSNTGMCWEVRKEAGASIGQLAHRAINGGERGAKEVVERKISGAKSTKASDQ